MDKKAIREIVTDILKAETLAMGVAIAVLSYMDLLKPQTAIALLIIGLVCATVALVMIAENGKQELRDQVSGTHVAIGACLGLSFGVGLNHCGLWQHHAIGITLGLLWGMALGAIYKAGRAQCRTRRE